MKTIKEIEKIGFFEEIENKIVLIEWPEKIEKILKKRIDISFIKKKEKFDRLEVRINFLRKKKLLIKKI